MLKLSGGTAMPMKYKNTVQHEQGNKTDILTRVQKLERVVKEAMDAVRFLECMLSELQGRAYSDECEYQYEARH